MCVTTKHLPFPQINITWRRTGRFVQFSFCIRNQWPAWLHGTLAHHKGGASHNGHIPHGSTDLFIFAFIATSFCTTVEQCPCYCSKTGILWRKGCSKQLLSPSVLWYLLFVFIFELKLGVLLYLLLVGVFFHFRCT